MLLYSICVTLIIHDTSKNYIAVFLACVSPCNCGLVAVNGVNIASSP